MALGHLVMLVPHDGGAVDVGGHLPAEGLVEKVVFGGGAEVFAAPDHVGDAHKVVVDDVGEVVGGQAVPLEEDLIVQGGVVHGDVAEDGVVEGDAPALGDFLADDIGFPGVHAGLGLLGAEGAAGVRCAVKVPGILLALGLLTEAVVGEALLHQQPGVPAVGVPPLRLDIGGHGTAHIGALVVGQAALGHGAVNHIRRALHQTALVRVLDTQDEGAAAIAGDKPGVKGSAQVAHVHVAGGGGGEAGADFAVGDLGLHSVKVSHVHCHNGFLLY